MFRSPAPARARATLFALAAGPLLLVACSPRPVARDLVIVCLDTVRADHLSSYGYERATDPAFARFAGEGVLFEEAWSPSNWTVPSVASLMTSLPPESHGAFVPGATRNLGRQQPVRSIRPGLETLAERLRSAGFHTGLLTANPFLRHHRFPDGFETFEGERRGARELTDRALAWLRDGDDRRRFLYVQYMDAHPPNRPPSRYAERFPAALGGARGPEHGDWSYGTQSDLDDEAFRRFREHRIATYDGTLRYLDDEVARLLDGLEAMGRLDGTLVVLTADHGEEFWDHAAAQAADPERIREIWGVGHGHTMYEELLHVPLVLRGPGFRGGRRSGCAASLLDIFPTALASLGLPPSDVARGSDLFAALSAEAAGGCRERPLFASQPAYGRESRAVRLGRWKRIETTGAPPLLFDLETDPAERRDLSREERATSGRLRKLLDELPPAVATGEEGAPTLESEEDLRALGYL